MGCATLKGEVVTVLESEHLLFQKNSDINSSNGSIALLIQKQIKHLVIETKAVLDRVIYIDLNLNKIYRLLKYMHSP